MQADYRLVEAAERVALLMQLRDAATPVFMQTADGTSLRTRLWVVDGNAQRLAFAIAAGELNSPQLATLLDADEVTAVAHPADVKLQFDLHDLVLVRGSASAVLQSGLPEQLLRFQRRESFRVTPPVSAPVAYLRHPAIPDMSLALRVLDLSLGGCALRLPDDVPPLVPGTCIGGVTIELDLNTRLRVELTLQHFTHFGGVESAAAGGGARIGCEWQLSRPEDARVLQRWIDHTQVRQRLVKTRARSESRAETAESGASQGD
jgi:c-di-GMP-binding flagellar brake protein YcgR